LGGFKRGVGGEGGKGTKKAEGAGSGEKKGEATTRSHHCHGPKFGRGSGKVLRSFGRERKTKHRDGGFFLGVKKRGEKGKSRGGRGVEGNETLALEGPPSSVLARLGENLKKESTGRTVFWQTRKAENGASEIGLRGRKGDRNPGNRILILRGGKGDETAD